MATRSRDTVDESPLEAIALARLEEIKRLMALLKEQTDSAIYWRDRYMEADRELRRLTK